jgi:hypothetical protein
MWQILYREKRTFERRLSVAGHVRLEICTDSGDVAVQQGRDGEVHVRGQVVVRGRPDLVRKVLDEIERHPPIEQTGTTIRIGDLDWEHDQDGCSVGLDYWIETPADTEVRVEVDSGDVKIARLRGPVVVEADSGDVALSGIEGDVEVNVDSGDIALSGIEGDVEVQVDSGDVEGSQLRGRVKLDVDSGDLTLCDVAGPVRVFVDSGDVKIADLGPELDLEVDSGDVRLSSAVPDGARWTVRADSGDVAVRLPRASRCAIEADTSSGDIDSDLPLDVKTRDEEASARGVVGAGGTARIVVSTDSGDIALRWANGK